MNGYLGGNGDGLGTFRASPPPPPPPPALPAGFAASTRHLLPQKPMGRGPLAATSDIRSFVFVLGREFGTLQPS